MTNLIEITRQTTARPETPLPEKERAERDPAARPRARERPPIRRLLVLAGIISVLAHLLTLWVVRVPAPAKAPAVADVRVDFEPVVPARPETATPPEAPLEESREPEPRVAERPAPVVEAPEAPIARPRPSERAPDARTIRPTTLGTPLAPLTATPGGIGRRASPADARRLEIMRAESLLASRLADLPGAGVPEEPEAGLAEGGGVTVPIPWGGFLPDDMEDGAWRRERCSGRDAGKDDKPGEREARRSGCD